MTSPSVADLKSTGLTGAGVDCATSIIHHVDDAVLALLVQDYSPWEILTIIKCASEACLGMRDAYRAWNAMCSHLGSPTITVNPASSAPGSGPSPSTAKSHPKRGRVQPPRRPLGRGGARIRGGRGRARAKAPSR